MEVLAVLGTRPEVIKFAPIAALMAKLQWRVRVVLTGQHDYQTMFQCVQQLRLPGDVSYYEGGGAQPTTEDHWRARFLASQEETPLSAQIGVVVGDTNSAYLAALRFARVSVPFVHVEAGLRLRELTEPEEANRRHITSLATWHLAPFENQLANCVRAGVPASRVIVCGDFSRLSLDYRLLNLSWPLPNQQPDQHRYWVATIHRRSNLSRLGEVAVFLDKLSETVGAPILLCKRDDTRLARLYKSVQQSSGVQLLQPRLPQQFIRLLAGAGGVVTDSAGVQQEATLGGLPTIVVRPEVELYGAVRTLHFAEDLNTAAATCFARSMSRRYWSYQGLSLDERFVVISQFLQRLE